MPRLSITLHDIEGNALADAILEIGLLEADWTSGQLVSPTPVSIQLNSRGQGTVNLVATQYFTKQTKYYVQWLSQRYLFVMPDSSADLEDILEDLPATGINPPVAGLPWATSNLLRLLQSPSHVVSPKALSNLRATVSDLGLVTLTEIDARISTISGTSSVKGPLIAYSDYTVPSNNYISTSTEFPLALTSAAAGFATYDYGGGKALRYPPRLPSNAIGFIIEAPNRLDGSLVEVFIPFSKSISSSIYSLYGSAVQVGYNHITASGPRLYIRGANLTYTHADTFTVKIYFAIVLGVKGAAGKAGGTGGKGNPGPQGRTGGPGPKGDAGPAIEVQYSIDGTTWLNSLADWRYVRSRIAGTVNWETSAMTGGLSNEQVAKLDAVKTPFSPIDIGEYYYALVHGDPSFGLLRGSLVIDNVLAATVPTLSTFWLSGQRIQIGDNTIIKLNVTSNLNPYSSSITYEKGSASTFSAGLSTITLLPALAVGDGTVLYGSRDPRVADGVDNDTWLNTSVGSIWVKSSGAWSKIYTIIGSTITVSTGVPAAGVGNNGDFHLTVNASSVIQTILFKVSGAWVAYTIPTGISSIETAKIATILTPLSPVVIGNYTNSVSDTGPRFYFNGEFLNIQNVADANKPVLGAFWRKGLHVQVGADTIVEIISATELDPYEAQIKFLKGVAASSTSTITLLNASLGGQQLYRARDPKPADGKNHDTWINTVANSFWLNTDGIWAKIYTIPSPPVKILAPGTHPTKADYDEHAAQWTGRRLVPVTRQVHGDHNAVYAFTTFDSNPSSATFGESPITTVALYANYARDFNGDVNYAWEWVSGQAVKEGDLCIYATRYYRCIVAHTTATANRATAAGQTTWIRYLPPSVVEASRYVGIYPEIAAIPSVYDITGKWAVITSGGHADIVQYISGGWNQYYIGSLDEFHGVLYADNLAAGAGVRYFISSEKQYFVIGGHLKQLTYLVLASAGTVSYPVDRSLNYPPVTELWGDVQTSRNEPEVTSSPYGRGNVNHIGSTAQFFRFKVVPSRLYFGATKSLIHILTDSEIGDIVGADSKPVNGREGIYFSLIKGLWKIKGTMTANKGVNAYPQLRLLRVNASGVDKVLEFSSITSYDTKSSEALGEPDAAWNMIFNADLVEVKTSDILYFAIVGSGFVVGAGAAGYMLFTYYGED